MRSGGMRLLLLFCLLPVCAWGQTPPATWTYCDNQPGPNRCQEVSVPVIAATDETYMRIDPKITAKLDRIEAMLKQLTDK